MFPYELWKQMLNYQTLMLRAYTEAPQHMLNSLLVRRQLMGFMTEGNVVKAQFGQRFRIANFFSVFESERDAKVYQFRKKGE